MIKYTWGKKLKDLKKKKTPTNFYRSNHFWRNHPKLKRCHLCSPVDPSSPVSWTYSWRASFTESEGVTAERGKTCWCLEQFSCCCGRSLLLERLKSPPQCLQDGGSEVLVVLWSLLFNLLFQRPVCPLLAAAPRGHTTLCANPACSRGPQATAELERNPPNI